MRARTLALWLLCSLTWIAALPARAADPNAWAGYLDYAYVYSSAEPDEPWHVYAPAQHSVWFTYTADRDRSVTIDTCGSNFDTLLAVYEGDTIGSLRKLASNDDSCAGNGSRVVIDAEGGVTYRIAVDGYGGRSGDYKLRLDAPQKR